MNLLNIIMIGPDLDVQGGISSVVREYLKAGLDKKVNLYFIPSHKDGSTSKKILVFIKAFYKFNLLLFKIKDPLIHLHVSKSGSFFRKIIFFLEAKKLNKKVIIHLHSSTFEEFRARSMIINYFVKLMFDNADRVIVLTEGWRETVQGFSSNKNVTKLYNSVVLKERVRNNLDEIIVLFLGRLCKEKGVYDLLNCILSNKKYFIQNNVNFFLAGDGEVKNLQDLVKESGLEEIITVNCWISGNEKEMRIKEASIFILPSYNEQMPMSILDGMTNGLPIVSTTVGGIPEIVEDGKNGILHEPGDIKAMGDALKRLCADEELRINMGIRSLEIVNEKFNASFITNQLVEIYESM